MLNHCESVYLVNHISSQLHRKKYSFNAHDKFSHVAKYKNKNSMVIFLICHDISILHLGLSHVDWDIKLE